MMKNKITYEHDVDEESRNIYRFTGSVREPTIGEIQNFINDNHLKDEINDYFMVCVVPIQNSNYSGWIEEENKTVEFWGYEGGANNGSCPICGHERDFSKDVCPVCIRKWD